MGKANQAIMEAGHDGRKPEFVTRKEFPWVDGKKEPTDSPYNVNHSTIAWLLSRHHIEQRQFDAAERLSGDWQKSLIDPVASSVLVGNGGSGGVANLPNDDKVAAMRRHGAAVAALGRNWPIVELVVEKNLSVEKAAAQLHIDRKVAGGRLYASLHFLADHYRL